MRVSIEAFILAADKDSPRFLAQTLFHEGIHVNQLSAKGGWRSREEMEWDAYKKSLDAAEIFELSEEDAEPTVFEAGYARAAWERVKKNETTPTSPFPSSFQMDERIIGIDEQADAADLAMDQRAEIQIDLRGVREKERLLRQSVMLGEDIRRADFLAAWACNGTEITPDNVRKFNHAAVLPGGVPPEAYGPELARRAPPPFDGLGDCAAALSYDILQALNRNYVLQADQINQKARERRTQADRKQLDSDAARCSFKLTRQDPYIAGFSAERNNSSPIRYRWTKEGDRETLKVSMLLARACLRVTDYRDNMNNPGWSPICDAAYIDILNRRWNDPVLHEFIKGTDTSHDQMACMARMMAAFQPPLSPADFRQAALFAAREFDRDLKEAERARKRNEAIDRHNRKIEERERRRRDREERGAPPSRDCLDPASGTNIIGCRQER